MQRMARSSAASLEAFLIERLASDATRSSTPTWSTLRTPRRREPRWDRETAVAIGCSIVPLARGGVRSGACLSRARGLEAVLAVDRPAAGGQEWHLGRLAAVGAD